jgi:hypothetical protein
MILTDSPESRQKHNHVHCTIEHINELGHLVVLLDPIYILKRRLWEWNGRDGMGRNEKEYEHKKVMISMNSSVLRKWAHPLNFFAGFAGSMNSDGESPCENRDSAHKTYLFVSSLSPILPYSSLPSSPHKTLQSR